MFYPTLAHLHSPTYTRQPRRWRINRSTAPVVAAAVSGTMTATRISAHGMSAHGVLAAAMASWMAASLRIRRHGYAT